MICPQPSLNPAHMGCSHGRVHDYSTRGSPHRCPGGRHPHRSSPGKRPGDGGRHRSQSPAAGRGLRHARGDQLTAERRPEAEQLPGDDHVLHAHPLQQLRRSHRALRHHRGGVRGVQKLTGGQRSRPPGQIWSRTGPTWTSRRPGGCSGPSLRQSRKSGRPT